MIRASAPTRIDLAGGTIDIWPACHLLTHPARTVNVALDRRAEATVAASPDGYVRLISLDRDIEAEFPAKVPDHALFPLASRLIEAILPDIGLELRVRSNVPRQSGLGGSSALAVAIGGALTQYAHGTVDADHFLRFVQNMETRLLGLPTGYQDYYPAIYGGVQSLTATMNGVRRRTIPEADEFLGRYLLLADTRMEHQSGMNNWEVLRAFLDGDKAVRGAMNRINECAYAMEKAIRAADLDATAEALEEEWQARRTLAPVVSNERVEALIAAARGAGARAANVCGAGGGGCIALMAEPEQHEAIGFAIEAEGGAMVDFGIDPEGLKFGSVEL
ncbi:MAG: GHMP family kinase ATP-binding protein [Planctomycetota bacterium]|jgi:D-glycero-alpha-D-manno-heptose-7-phosphate kinase